MAQRPAWWKPSAWSEGGSEPDYRFSLANERTFLAWVRTALAIMAAAVAVVQLVDTGRLHEFRRVLGVVLAVLGLGISVAAYPRWAAIQRAMRLGEPMPPVRLLPVVGAVLVLIGLGVVVLVIGG